MRIDLYAQMNNTVIVDGIPLAGFAEGDFMEIDVDGNAAQRSLGGDGPAMNLSVQQGGKISISLLPTSPAIGELYGIRNVQAVTPRLFTIVLLTGVNETIHASGCAFGKLPSFSSGADKMAARKFDFECLKVEMDTSAIEALSSGWVGGLI